ncbi:MAG: hypothetical protein HYW03_03495 [Deltaproteobacteria bacterium]|nr:hypothetical protein [Deltaproteobacteria bacterium]
MGLLRRSLNDLVRVDVNAEALARLAWRDFGNGLSMCRLAREGARELVLYRIREGAAPDAFLKHEHIGGEFYLVLKGRARRRAPGRLKEIHTHEGKNN